MVGVVSHELILICLLDLTVAWIWSLQLGLPALGTSAAMLQCPLFRL